MMFTKKVHDNVEWHVIELSEEDVNRLQDQHNRNSAKILKECFEVVEDKNPFIVATLFNKRCPSFMNMIENALETRAGNVLKRSSVMVYDKSQSMRCPNCNSIMNKYFRTGYKWWCGICKKYKVKATVSEIATHHKDRKNE